jgi:hypothetical protein
MQRTVNAKLLEQLGDYGLDHPGDQISDEQDDQEPQQIGDEAKQRVQSLLDAVGDMDRRNCHVALPC